MEWKPSYWFVLNSIAETYPMNPNDISKKKYYEFVQNIPLFIPDKDIGCFMAGVLEQYPVTPYMDTRITFTKWMAHILYVIDEHIEIKNENKTQETNIPTSGSFIVMIFLFIFSVLLYHL